jgi:hypothetical protein
MRNKNLNLVEIVPDKDEPLRMQIGGMLEILIQNLLFCIIICTNWRELKNMKNTEKY